MTRKKHSETEGLIEAEVSILPRETWDSLKGALEVFEEALRKANELSKAPRDDAGRVAALKSLEAVLKLIEQLYPENREELRGPIFQTYQALVGLQKGATPKGAAPHPLLIPKSTKGRPPNRPEVERVQAEAAAAMELFMQAGDSKDVAARKVFRRVRQIDLKSLGYKGKSYEGITHNTIAGWRANFTGRAGNSIGAQPVSVWVVNDGEAVELVAGAHRVEAAKKLGWEKIDCVFVDMDSHDRQLWQIDENLHRFDLTELQRAQHTAKRAEVIRQKVESANLAKTKSDPSRNADKGQTEFVADTAKKTGKSKRSVERDKARGDKIADDVQKDIEGTAIANSGVQLDALAAATPWDQREAVKAVNLGDAKDVRDVLPEAKGKRGKSRRTKEEIQLVEFDRVIRFISTACEVLPKINVPNLDSKRRSQAIADLRNARKHIEELIQIVQNARDENPAP